ncbi:MAG: CoA pyrophosphatase [Chitinophagales bacterium]|nr:CoA pyrophosphatase [Chitinophagales bacterium]
MQNDLRDDFILCLKDCFSRPLPGESAQYRLAPEFRPRLTAESITALNPRRGAVLVLLYQKQKEWYMLLTLRRKYPGVHSGQMSFPGGKFEATDPSLIHTALREAQEEVGLPQQHIETIGQLTQLYIPPSNFLVQPVVGFTYPSPTFAPNSREVEQIVEIPVSFFLNDSNITHTRVEVGKNLYATVPAFIYKHYTIWGATAIILSEFREVWKEAQLNGKNVQEP